MKHRELVLFDAYGTLFDVHSAVQQLQSELGEQAAAISDLWRQRQVEYTWLLAGMGRYAPFWSVTEDALDFALQAHGVASARLRDRLLDAYRAPSIYDDVPTTLDELRRLEVRAAVFTNADPAMVSGALDASGIADRFDVVVSTDELRTFKPMPATYAHALERARVTADSALFVTANGWDAAGATSAGLTVAWCNRARAPRERLGIDPAFEVHALPDTVSCLSIRD
jgi:2-haloacid dehalogenase